MKFTINKLQLEINKKYQKRIAGPIMDSAFQSHLLKKHYIL